jgi:hypothetical protein
MDSNDRDLLIAAQKVVEAARTPECNFSTERECGSHDGVYHHHKKWCPRGRLEAALAEYDALVKIEEDAKLVQKGRVADLANKVRALRHFWKKNGKGRVMVKADGSVHVHQVCYDGAGWRPATNEADAFKMLAEPEFTGVGR